MQMKPFVKISKGCGLYKYWKKNHLFTLLRGVACTNTENQNFPTRTQLLQDKRSQYNVQIIKSETLEAQKDKNTCPRVKDVHAQIIFL